MKYNKLVESYSKKIIILGECGGVLRINDQWNTGTKWDCFMLWYKHNRTKNTTDEDFQMTEPAFANKEWWKDAWQQNFVLSHNELSSFK